MIVTDYHVSLGDLRPAVADYPAGATFGPRVCPSYELVWLLSGSARWVWHDGRRSLSLAPGVLLLARPGMVDEYRWDERRSTRHGYVHFSVTPEPDDPPLLRPMNEPGPLPALLRYLLWLAEEPGPAWAERAADVVGLILRAFVDGPLPDAVAPPEPPALAAALDHVRRQWALAMRSIRLDELAAAAGTSRAHLARLFRREYGVGPVTALELVRLARAESLLVRSNLTVTRIAHDCGFADPLHFSRRFRAAYGVAPRTYRRSGGTRSPLAAAGLLPLARRLGTDD